jgi:pimeloyl-ACP methyl ester carboxylesterase
MTNNERTRPRLKIVDAIAVGLLLYFSSALVAVDAKTDIAEESGEFELTADAGRTALAVDYYKPRSFTGASPVLVVLSGAGRNSAEYRDAWITASKKYGVLILSPKYPEDMYAGIEKYNLAGMISDLKRDATAPEGATYKIVKNPQQWLFADFDRIFLRARETFEFNSESYDVFGHSAGAQVAHRLALFQPITKANRIIAANSGWYTVPTLADKFPYGIGNGFVSTNQVRRAFSRRLVVMLGQLDDENETRGDLMRTPQIDVQGLGRLQRGKHFYDAATVTSKQMAAPLRWEILVVPGVGHDFRKMSDAAADFLYGSQRGKLQ